MKNSLSLVIFFVMLMVLLLMFIIWRNRKDKKDFVRHMDEEHRIHKHDMEADL